MDEFEVLESDRFKMELEEAVLWLYSHNLEQSQDFADQKYFELQQEVNALKNHLKRNPQMGKRMKFPESDDFPFTAAVFLRHGLWSTLRKPQSFWNSLIQNIRGNCVSSIGMTERLSFVLSLIQCSISVSTVCRS